LLYLSLSFETDSGNNGRTESIGNVESVKAVGEIYAPVSGQVKEVNQELEGTPELINQDPETTGKQCAPDESGRTRLMRRAHVA